jgi:hypothetical protein
MDSTAVEQAKTRLNKAEKALEALKTATNFAEAEEAWTDFLLAAATIYSKLEQGSKSSGKSSGWFARKKKERKDDPLLRYLHHARNSDEHGIESVVSRLQQGSQIFGKNLKFGEREPVKIQKLDETTRQPIGEAVDGFYAAATIRLVRVHDRRYNDFFDPPPTHLRKPDQYYEEPHDVGVVGLGYLKGLISEAEALVAAPKS